MEFLNSNIEKKEHWINNNKSTDLDSLNANIKSISSKLTSTLKILNLTKLQFAESVLITDKNFLDSLLKTPKIKELENEEKKVIEQIEHWINNNNKSPNNKQQVGMGIFFSLFFTQANLNLYFHFY
jgi:hypothetical protein